MSLSVLYFLPNPSGLYNVIRISEILAKKKTLTLNFNAEIACTSILKSCLWFWFGCMVKEKAQSYTQLHLEGLRIGFGKNKHLLIFCMNTNYKLACWTKGNLTHTISLTFNMSNMYELTLGRVFKDDWTSFILD